MKVLESSRFHDFMISCKFMISWKSMISWKFMISWNFLFSWKLTQVQESSRKFMKVHDFKISLYVFMFLWLHENSCFYYFIKQTTATTATAFSRELMVFLLPRHRFFFWELQNLKFSSHEELLPPWRPFESPRPKRLCAATHCRTIAPTGFHSLPRFIELQFCFQAACSRSNLSLVFRGHGFMERNMVTLATPS